MTNEYSHLAIDDSSGKQSVAKFGEAMSEEDILSYIDTEVADAISYDELVALERARNINYYFREPIGNEKIGRSAVQTSDVAEITDGLVVSILDQFTSTENVVEHTARGPEDVEGAEQATLLCNYVFYSQNSGFLRLYECIQDGILQKAGVYKAWWDAKSDVEEAQYRLSESEFMQLQQSQDAEIVEFEIEQSEEIPGVQQYVCTIRRKVSKGQVRVECVPPEEIKVSPRARSADIREAPFVVHETPKTRAQLIQDGYDPELVAEVPSGYRSSSMDESSDDAIRSARRQNGYDDDDDPSNNMIWVQECFFRIDTDGDGVEEWRKVCRVGSYILSNIVIDDMGLTSWTPKPMSHEYNGNCPADDAREIQDQKTAILRQTFDSLYQASTPRWQVAKGRVNMDDLLTAVPGGAVRMDNIGDAVPLLMPFIGQQTFPMIEYMDSWRESWTGVTRYNQGLDANSLNKTATGINLITSMSQQKIRLYARLFAELALKPLFKSILGLLSKHQMESLSVRLNNNFVQIDPKVWNTEYDMTINVGLGTGNKDQQLMHLSQINQLQGQLAASPLGQLLIKPKNVFNVVAKITENAGFKDASQYWTDPGEQMPPPPPPPPQMIKDQAEHALAQEKEKNRHSERMIELRLEMAKLGMPMAVMQELGMPDPIGLGLPMPPPQQPMQPPMPPQGMNGAPPNVPMQ